MFSRNLLNNKDELKISSFIKHITDDVGIERTPKSLKLRAFSMGSGSYVVNSHPQTSGTYSEASGFVNFTFI